MTCFYFDFLILPEHHCLPNETFEIDKFKFFQNNRPIFGGGARRGSGGIAIAVNDSIFETHTLVSVSKGADGQISVKLKNSLNDFMLGILALYLPPDNYVYGKDPESFFNHATVLWEDLFDCDLIIGGGDLNARTKDIIDYVPDIDGNLIPTRENPDKVKNSHAEPFITFLKDNRSIILNGRITPKFNNFTFVNPRGCSVPDYLFSPIDHLNHCTEMRTVLMSDIVNLLNIQPPKSLPDHSILIGTFITSLYEKCTEQLFPTHFPNIIQINDELSSARKVKKNLSKMPSNFFMTDAIYQQVLETINAIENVQANKSNINQLWVQIKGLFSKELGKLPSMYKSNNKKQKKLFRKSQAFWNPELEDLWRATSWAEKEFLAFKVESPADNFNKNQLRQKYKNAQKLFDKKFRQTERKYKKQKIIELENYAKFDPTKMWSNLKKLNNPPSSRAVLEIIRNDNTLSRDVKEVLERWFIDISKLFSRIKDNPKCYLITNSM